MNLPLNPDFSTPINLPDFSGLDLNFEIIDAHHHLFDLDEVYYPWLTDEPEKHFLLGNYDALKRNYSCEDYRKDTEKLKIVKTVHVEAESDHQDPLRETEWLNQVMEGEGMPNAIVAHSKSSWDEAQRRMTDSRSGDSSWELRTPSSPERRYTSTSTNQ